MVAPGLATNIKEDNEKMNRDVLLSAVTFEVHPLTVVEDSSLPFDEFGVS